MRVLPLLVLTLCGAAPVGAQARLASPAASVTLIARKLGTVGVHSTGVEAQRAGLHPTDDQTALAATPISAVPAITTHWNLPPEQVRDLRLRTSRGAARRGASYIERRVLLSDPIDRRDDPLELASDTDATPADALVVVRLVLY